MDVSAAVLPIHLLVIRSARGLGVLFDGNISGFGVNIFTGAFTIATITSVTALNTVAPVSCATDVGTNDVIDMLPITVIGVVSGSDVDILAGVVVNPCTAATISFESMAILPSSKDAFHVDCKTSRR